MQRTGFKPRQTGLARTTGLARQSKSRRAGQAAQKRAYAGAADDERGWCSVCGKPGPTEHMHLYTQKQRPDLRNEPLNWLVVGSACGCHRLEENNKPEFARQFPKAWRLMLSRMEALDAAAFAAFRLKNPF